MTSIGHASLHESHAPPSFPSLSPWKPSTSGSCNATLRSGRWPLRLTSQDHLNLSTHRGRYICGRAFSFLRFALCNLQLVDVDQICPTLVSTSSELLFFVQTGNKNASRTLTPIIVIFSVFRLLAPGTWDFFVENQIWIRLIRKMVKWTLTNTRCAAGS